jgi:hypothetical protein
VNATVKSVEDVLVQGLNLLESLGEETYARVAAAPFRASIGQHYRHILDHFVSLAHGLAFSEIDYDRRARNREWEMSISAAREATQQLLDSFRVVDHTKTSEACSVLLSVGYRTAPEQMQSVVAREIAYCVSHAVHHFAIIRFIAESFGFEVAPELGIAPSTIRHRVQVAAGN